MPIVQPHVCMHLNYCIAGLFIASMSVNRLCAGSKAE